MSAWCRARALVRSAVKLAVLAGVFTGLGLGVANATSYVKGNATGSNDGTSWANAYTNLQPAIDNAPADSEIWVAAGTYKPTGTGRAATYVLKQEVAIFGGFNGTETALLQRNFTTNVTILSGDIGTASVATDNCYHVVTGATGGLLDGFTIRDGYADGTSPSDMGGGIYNAAAAPALRNCTFINNHAVKGGAVANVSASAAAFTACLFSNNHATTAGGAIYNNNSAAIFVNSEVANNQAPDGAGIYNDQAAPDISFTRITGNAATGNGGGVYNYNAASVLSECWFTTNTAATGAGMFNNLPASVVSTRSCVFYKNTATANGGAIDSEGGARPRVINCTLNQNTAATGAGMYNKGVGTTATITNSIIWGNTTTQLSKDSFSTVTVTFSCVQGGGTADGNINTDPAFKNATTGDLNLLKTSPCIDTGTTGINIPPIDYAGLPRDPKPDIGAFEYQWPTLTIDSVSVAEGVGDATVAVSLTGVNEFDAYVDYATSAGTATATTDYTDVNGTLHWAVGETGPKAITIHIVDDGEEENPETVNINLQNPVKALLPINQGILTIQDNDGQPRLALVTPVDVPENVGNAIITVNLVGANGAGCSCTYATANGTATAGSDYTAAGGTLTWPASDTAPKTFEVPITNDTTGEDNETVTLSITNPTNATITVANGVLTIQDNDNLPTIAVGAPVVPEDVGAAIVPVIMSGANPNATVTVDYATSNGTATSGSDYVSAAGTLSWAATQTGQKSFSVTITDDTAVEGDETVTVTLSNVQNATISDGTGTITIQDNDRTLTIAKGGAGSGSVKVNTVLQALPFTGTFPMGVTVNLEAVPATGAAFINWTGDLTTATNPIGVVMDANKSVAANFGAVRTLTIAKGGTAAGTVKVNDVSKTLPYTGNFGDGAVVTIEAVAGTGAIFSAWSGDVTGTTNPTTVTMDANKSVTATFATAYTLSIAKSGTGTGTVKVNTVEQTLPYTGTFASGANVALEAVAGTDSVFTEWSGAVTGTTNPTTVTMSANRSVTASFSGTYTLAIAKGGTGDGTVKVNNTNQTLPYSGTFAGGTVVTLEAVAASGSLFAAWSGDLTGTTNPTTITVDANKAVTASFGPAYTLTISKGGEGAGSVTVNGVAQTLPYTGSLAGDSTATLVAVPGSNSAFTEWSGDATGTNVTTTVSITGNKAVTATFGLNPQYALTVSLDDVSTGTGKVKVNGGAAQALPYTANFYIGTEVTLQAVADDGSMFTGWDGDVTGTSNPTTVTVNGPTDVTATFDEAPSLVVYKYTRVVTTVADDAASAKTTVNGAVFFGVDGDSLVPLYALEYWKVGTAKKYYRYPDGLDGMYYVQPAPVSATKTYAGLVRQASDGSQEVSFGKVSAQKVTASGSMNLPAAMTGSITAADSAENYMAYGTVTYRIDTGRSKNANTKGWTADDAVDDFVKTILKGYTDVTDE